MKITEKAQEILQRLLDAFEKGTIPDALARTVIPALDIPCSQWSLNNRLLAFFADTQDARGMRQWNEVGRHVLPGRKAFYILAPLRVKKKRKKECRESRRGQRKEAGRNREHRPGNHPGISRKASGRIPRCPGLPRGGYRWRPSGLSAH